MSAKTAARTKSMSTKSPLAQAAGASRRNYIMIGLAAVVLGAIIWLLGWSSEWSVIRHEARPSSEMQALTTIEKSLPLPRPVSRDREDRGCYTDHNLDTVHRCVRHIGLSFDSTTSYPKLTAYLQQHGWTAVSYPTYGVVDGSTSFWYRKDNAVNGQVGCVSGYVQSADNTTHLPLPQLYVSISGPTENGCPAKEL